MNNTIELKYPIPIIEKGEKKEIKFLIAGRLKVKHFELLPASLLEKSEGNSTLNVSAKEMLPIFNELIPFIAGIFNISVESAKEIDFEDIESVISVLESVFPKDEKNIDNGKEKEKKN